ncbi:beta-galactosidase [Tessaracoccus sp. Z1128]
MTTPWPAIAGIAYGGDYNPEQWPRPVWEEDVTLMRRAGVTLVSVGIFSWAKLEPASGTFDFGWLDELLDLLHANGIAVDLGTPTASPPAWFFADHPEARVITRDGTVMGFGSRGMAAPSSTAYRDAAARIAGALAERYAEHPAVVLWHIHNEYGTPVGEDYSPTSVQAWREWLRTRYGSLDALNDAWGTAVWGQTYHSWDHIGAPAAAPSVVNPTMRLDFARFTDNQMRECFAVERDAIRRHATQPITTNFMANQHWGTDLWEWAKIVDVVSDDHYLTAADPEAEIGLAMAADLTRSVAGGRPWILMEHSTSAVNWQPRNVAKRPGQMARNSLAHVARGADAVLFFQWRAARYGQEKFHSAMLPHAGTESRVFREVVELGATLRDIADIRGSRVEAEVAVLWDFESFWAQDLEWRPSEGLDHRKQVRAYYERLWRDRITVDFALPSHDLTRYRLVVVPAQYLLRADDATALIRYVEQGGTLVVSCFSAVVDEHDAVHRGGFLRPLEPALGVWVEEFLPLRDGDSLTLDGPDGRLRADVWAEDLVLTSAEAVATYVDGPAAGKPAITRHRHGAGTAWYLSTCLDAPSLQAVMGRVYSDAGLAPTALPDGVEVVTRHGAGATFTVAINHNDHAAELPLPGTDLVTGHHTDGTLRLEGGAVAVVRSEDTTRSTPEH